MNKIYQIYQVSDSTGETLDRIFSAIKAQFSNFNCKTIHYSFTRTKNQVDKIISNSKIKKAVNQLLKKKSNTNLYVNATTIRIDVPGITPYVYGWHRDNNANIEDSDFIQLWAPIISDIDKKIGGLSILEKSHGKNIKTDRSDRERQLVRDLHLPSRPLLNAKIISKDKLKEKKIYCKLGNVILFQNSLLHKSGINRTQNKIRYVMATFYHDLFSEKWKFRLLNEKSSSSKLTK